MPNFKTDDDPVVPHAPSDRAMSEQTAALLLTLAAGSEVPPHRQRLLVALAAALSQRPLEDSNGREPDPAWKILNLSPPGDILAMENPAVPRKRVFAVPHPTPDGAVPHPAVEIPGGVALSPEQLAWIRSMFDRLDREAHGAKVKGALESRKARGMVVGQVPYGWRRDGDVLVQVPEEQDAIRRMIELRELGETPARITQALQREGFPARGKRWYQTSVQNILAAADDRASLTQLQN